LKNWNVTNFATNHGKLVQLKYLKLPFVK